MTRFRFTNKAVEDLSAIWNYTFDTWSEKQPENILFFTVTYRTD